MPILLWANEPRIAPHGPILTGALAAENAEGEDAGLAWRDAGKRLEYGQGAILILYRLRYYHLFRAAGWSENDLKGYAVIGQDGELEEANCGSQGIGGLQRRVDAVTALNRANRAIRVG